MKSFDQLSEDLATRRAELKQRQREQGAKFKQKGAERVGAAIAKTDALKKRTTDDARSSLDRIKQMAAQKRAAEKERKARQKERENISAEIAASREQKKDEVEKKREDREDDIKAKEKKRMSKERKREELQKTLDAVG